MEKDKQIQMENLTLKQLRILYHEINDIIIDKMDEIENNMTELEKIEDKIKENDEINFLLDIEDIDQRIYKCIEISDNHTILIQYIKLIMNKNENIAKDALLKCSEMYNIPIELFEYLAKKSNDINIKDVVGCTPLLNVCCESINQLKLIKILVENGANIHHSDNYGWNPLLLLCSEENIDCSDSIEYLLSKGCDPNSKNKYLKSCLELVFDRINDNNLKLFKILIQHGADINTMMNGKPIFESIYELYSSREDYIDILGLFINHGVKYQFKIDKETKNKLVEKGYLKSKSKNLFKYINDKKITEGTCIECKNKDLKLIQLDDNYELCFECLYQSNFYN